MRLLLDSHVLLWAIDQPALLSPAVRKAIQNEANELYASVASIWEITIKAQSGRLDIPDVEDFLSLHLAAMGIQHFLPVSLAHVLRVSRLPAHHKDPFDRVLIAQALTEGLTLISKDEIFQRYPVDVRWRRV
ncbi:MAG: type II toxin-antitoxin system VapC family toxin [Bryobacteraceae bacterium]